MASQVLNPAGTGIGSPVTTYVSVLGAVGEVNDAYPSWEAVWRLLAAAALGAAVGLEREINDQPAGLRTHITVALGAAVFGVISTLGFSEFVAGQREVNIQFDVTRVASQVVVGIGFIGAGVIFRSGSKVRNLTTAASLWVTAAFGLAAGVGDIGIAVVAAAGLLAALLVLRVPRDAIRARVTREVQHIAVRFDDIDHADAVIDAIRAVRGVTVTRVTWGKADGDPTVDLTLQGDPRVDPAAELAAIVARPDVISLRTDIGLTSEQADED